VRLSDLRWQTCVVPWLGPSIENPEVGRDATRAFELWRDELVVWMLPEFREPRRWRRDGIGYLAVPAEEFDRIDVVHVTEDGRVHNRAAREKLPRTVDGLLDAWLNLLQTGGLSWVPPPDLITVECPFVNPANEIVQRKRTISFGPGSYVPVHSVNRVTHETTMIWPPAGSPSPVSPEAESARQFPSKKLASDPPTVITKQGDVGLQVFLRWHGPLELIMPRLSGVEDMHAQAQMAGLARHSTADLAGASRAAAVTVQPYLSRGHSTVEHLWFRPTLERRGPRHILFKAEDRWLTVPPQLRQKWDENALNEVLKQEAWQKWLAEPIPIRRAWGGVGLFWTLLLDHLEAQRSFTVCERCGRIISGKEGKRFCGKSDDSACFNERRAVDQRRSRQGRVSTARQLPETLP
jgi:hypothetical protein